MSIDNYLNYEAEIDSDSEDFIKEYSDDEEENNKEELEHKKAECEEKCIYLLKELKLTFDELYPMIDIPLYNKLCNLNQQLNMAVSNI